MFDVFSFSCFVAFISTDQFTLNQEVIDKIPPRLNRSSLE